MVAIQQALEFEQKGAKFYIDQAAQETNPLVRSLFSYLALEEVQHFIRIDDHTKASTSQEERPRELESRMREVFETAKSEIQRGVDNVRGLELAMEIERSGYEMYKKQAATAQSEAEKEFLLWLMREEQEHLAALENVHAYLTQTGDWFHSEERQVWNWMNTRHTPTTKVRFLWWLNDKPLAIDKHARHRQSRRS